jgi:bifunctional DNase/RNase
MEETMTTETARAWVELRVAGVRRRAGEEGRPNSYCLLLEETDGPRKLPIWVGAPEARAVVCKLEGIDLPRPPSDLFAHRLLSAVGGGLVEVRITCLADEVFFATAVVEGPNGRVEVDARPSDAINLALLAGAPIRADRALMEQAGVVPDEEASTLLAGTGEGEIAAEIRGELRERSAR